MPRLLRELRRSWNEQTRVAILGSSNGSQESIGVGAAGAAWTGFLAYLKFSRGLLVDQLL